MGRIKSTMVKKTAKNLFTKEFVFTDSFDNNKKILGNTMPSKPIRNKIAGYLARLSKMQKAGPKVKKTPETNAFEMQADSY
jgi:ribosomal protein S17E